MLHLHFSTQGSLWACGYTLELVEANGVFEI